MQKEMNLPLKLLGLIILWGLFFLIIFPVLWMIISSLKTNNEIIGATMSWPTKLQWSNYAKAWERGKLGSFFINSIIVTTASLVGVIIFPLAASYVFARKKFPGRNLLFIIWLVGLMIPVQAKVIPLFQIMNILKLNNTHWAMIVSYWGSTSLALFIFKTFFETLPDELEDAAQIDGCSDFRVFYSIAIPLSKPSISVVGIFYMVYIWNAFLEPLILLRGEKLFTLPIGLMFFKGQYSIDYGLMFAALTISSIVPILVYVVFQKNFVKGLTSGMGKM